jgi:hypothetical protein
VGLHRYVVAVGDQVVRCHRDTAFELRGQRAQQLVNQFLLAVESPGVLGGADNGIAYIVRDAVEKRFRVAFDSSMNMLLMNCLFSAAPMVFTYDGF